MYPYMLIERKVEIEELRIVIVLLNFMTLRWCVPSNEKFWNLEYGKYISKLKNVKT